VRVLEGRRRRAIAHTEHRGGVLPRMTALALWSPAPSIYSGTDAVQRNIISERALGFPRD